MPGDTGPKTNPLQLQFDRYETLYCAGKLETLPKTTVRLHWPLWKWLRVSPVSTISVPFTVAKNVQLYFSPLKSVNSLFFNMRVQTGYHYLVNEHEIIQH